MSSNQAHLGTIATFLNSYSPIFNTKVGIYISKGVNRGHLLLIRCPRANRKVERQIIPRAASTLLNSLAALVMGTKLEYDIVTKAAIL
jgi:hypothetical protein